MFGGGDGPDNALTRSFDAGAGMFAMFDDDVTKSAADSPAAGAFSFDFGAGMETGSPQKPAALSEFGEEFLKVIVYMCAFAPRRIVHHTICIIGKYVVPYGESLVLSHSHNCRPKIDAFT